MGYIIIFLIISFSLAINIFVAMKFEAIAKMKGHTGYLGWCFWLGAIGWAMVIALPDRNREGSIQKSGNAHSSPAARTDDDTLPEL